MSIVISGKLMVYNIVKLDLYSSVKHEISFGSNRQLLNRVTQVDVADFPILLPLLVLL
jgi:hypothetical protein